ncbi:leucyl aminopeptidase family protein [Candidatus Gracilibacteria bacterium]|nr:leucyl aminopeptidase family protein [Candidatus Gracilibacteria bacterium]
MIKYVHQAKDISYDNIVLFISSQKELSHVDFLKLDTNILKDIKKHSVSKKSCLQEYFLGGTKYKKLYVFISAEKTEEAKVNFLGKHLPKLPDNLCITSQDIADLQMMLELCELSRYKFQNYKTKKIIRKTQVLCNTVDKKGLQETMKTVENICLARDLGETPAADLTPEIFADIVKKTKFKNIKVKVLKYKDIQKKGLGLIEGVGKGSDNKPCMVILEHIVDKKKPVSGIVGKGVTFDTGGNQIKPGDFMYDMKGDMGGAAVTFALMKELDRHNIDKNIVACLSLAENVVSSNAYKPSDILTGYTGKTVEIIHTDAEGRLVLADGIAYLGKKYKTDRMMTIATLTGAVMVALGFRYAGIMGTDRQMLDTLLDYSKENTEKYVELPFGEHFMEKTKSEIADFKNLDRGVYAGSSMGGAFLSNFLVNNEKYTHIDIAGAYINEGDPYGKMPKGMTGFGVESLSEIFKNS